MVLVVLSVLSTASPSCAHNAIGGRLQAPAEGLEGDCDRAPRPPGATTPVDAERCGIDDHDPWGGSPADTRTQLINIGGRP